MQVYVFEPSAVYCAEVFSHDDEIIAKFKFRADADALAIGFVSGLFASRVKEYDRIDVMRDDLLVGWVNGARGDMYNVFDYTDLSKEKKGGD